MPSFGTLKADTLTHSTAGSLATNFVVNGSAKATVAADSAASIYDSLNISSGSDEGTGDYDYNVTSAFTATVAEKCCGGVCIGTTAVLRIKAARATASVIDIAVLNSSFNNADGNHALAVHGDLA